MSRRRRHMETSEVALMAVMTKAMGAFLILMVYGMQYVVPDMTAEQISKIVQESLQRTKSDLNRTEKNLGSGGASTTGGAAQARADIASALQRLDEAAADIERLRVRLDQAIAQLRRSEDERARLSAENDQLKAELAKAQALVASLQAQVAALTAERDKLAAQLQSLAQARQDLAQAANALNRGDVTKAEIDAVRKQVEAAQAALEKEEAENAELRAQLAEAKDTIRKLQDEDDKLKKTAADATAALAAALMRASMAEASAADLRAKLAEAESTITKLQDEDNALKQALKAMTARLDSARTDLVAASGHLKTAEAGISDLTQRLAKAEITVKQLSLEKSDQTKAFQNITSERDDLRNDNKRLKDSLAASDREISFQIFYGPGCKDAKVEIVVSRLPPTEKGEQNTIIQPAQNNKWSPIVIGDMEALGNIYDFPYNVQETNGKYIRTSRWDFLVVKDQEIFAMYVLVSNSLDEDSEVCDGDVLLSSRDPSVGLNYRFTVDISQKALARIDILKYTTKSGIALVEETDDEFKYVLKRFIEAPCRALVCAEHSKENRGKLHQLLVGRHGADLTGTQGIELAEKTAASKTLDTLIESFGDEHIPLRDLERWVALLKTTTVPPRDRVASRGEHALSLTDIALMRQRLVQQNVPSTVLERFQARALMGWWTEEEAQRRLTTANIASIADSFDNALKSRNLPRGPGSFAAVARPAIEKGTMTLLQGLAWVDLLSKQGPATQRDADPVALARAEDVMHKKGLTQTFVAAIEAAARAKTVRLEDVDRALARTEAAVP